LPLLQADRFVKSGRALRRKMWWNNCKMKVVMGFVVAMVIIIIVLLVCFSSSVRCIKKGSPKSPSPAPAPAANATGASPAPSTDAPGHHRKLLQDFMEGMLMPTY
jgi:hypothetical protein